MESREEFPSSGWPVGISAGECLLTAVGWPSQWSVAPFPGYVPCKKAS